MSASPWSRYLSSLDAPEGGDGSAGVSGRPDSSTVACWGDVLKARYAPSSLLALGGRTSTGDVIGPPEGSCLSSSSAFDAFTMGGDFMCEPMTDRFRGMLEGTDSLQGVQAIIDVDSGFGGLGLDFLAFVADECPRAPLLVFGAAPPQAQTTGAGAAPALSAVDYLQRDRAAQRSINLGLALAAFGGGSVAAASSCLPGLDAVYMPLIAQLPPPGTNPVLAGDYYTSALHAAAVDMLTLPARRVADFDGEEPLETALVAYSEETRVAEGSGAAASAAGAGRSQIAHHFDPAVEVSPDRPLVAFPAGASLADVCAVLAPRPSARVASLSLAAPLPRPRATATGLHELLVDGRYGHVAPINAPSTATFLPLSWPCALPASWNSAAAAAAPASLSFHSPRSGTSSFVPPFSHALILRGVGTHALTARGATPRYASTLDAYGRVVDAVLEAAGTSCAAHAVLRTPLPVPVTFPYEAFSSGPSATATGRFDPFGAAVPEEGDEGSSNGSSADAWSGDRPTWRRGASSDAAPLPACEVPFTTPAAVYASNGPSYAPALRWVARGFAARDASVLHRYEPSTSGAGRASLQGTSEVMREVESVLGALVDDYAVSRM